MYYLIYNVFQCLILPSSWLLCQIGGSTCTPLQIELLKLKLSKHEGPGLYMYASETRSWAIRNLSELWNANSGG